MNRSVLRVIVFAGLVLLVGGCSLPWAGGNTDQEDKSQEQRENSRKPLVYEEEWAGTEALEGRSDTGFVNRGETGARIRPEATRNTKRARELAQRARQAFEDDRLSDALELFVRAYQHDPENVKIISNIGSLYYRLEEYPKAARYYRRALEVDPEDFFALFYLGVTYYQQGQRIRARDAFRRALEVRPGSEKAQRWLDKTRPTGS